jgi:hypothetical protein
LKELKGEIDRSAVTVEEFNASLSIMDRISSQKTNKAIRGLESHYMPNGHSRPVQNFLLNSSQCAHSSQAQMDCSPGWIICCFTKQVLNVKI